LLSQYENIQAAIVLNYNLFSIEGIGVETRAPARTEKFYPREQRFYWYYSCQI
jgi:hypothetical protein